MIDYYQKGKKNPWEGLKEKKKMVNDMNAIELNDALKAICNALNKMNDKLNPAIINTKEITETQCNIDGIKEELRKMFNTLENTRVSRLPQLYNKQQELKKQLYNPGYIIEHLLGEQLCATEKDKKIFESALKNYKQAIDTIIENHKDELKNLEVDWCRRYLYEEDEYED